MVDLLCHRSFFSCKDNTLNVGIINNNSNKGYPFLKFWYIYIITTTGGMDILSKLYACVTCFRGDASVSIAVRLSLSRADIISNKMEQLAEENAAPNPGIAGLV